MKIEAGELSRVILNLPPRHGKTINVSEYFPAWYMGRNPDRQIIATTYNSTRAGDVGRRQMDFLQRRQLLEVLRDAVGERLVPTQVEILEGGELLEKRQVLVLDVEVVQLELGQRLHPGEVSQAGIFPGKPFILPAFPDFFSCYRIKR